MGFFGTYLYAGNQWTDHDPDQPVEAPGPWLQINIHDSDFTIVSYHPPYEGTGVAYLGYTPRMYFESETEHPRTNTTQEAAGLATWSTTYTATTPADLLPYLAEDQDTFDQEDEDEEDDEDLPDSEIYVEVKTADFLTTLGLPLPPALDQLLA
ncbi:hypothetical protein OHA70_00550 [Kribbella sp. NBC_00382]|uniref:hypothetical protein n=1 Tax=Kribbella sp. NBC_00382 TaxID=2975967 RepID=UPI002E1E804E